MSEEKKTPPRGDKPDDANDSEVTREHRALMNQSSTDPQEYPEEERAAQSLVDKSKRRDQSD
ncbi:hypothetical protein [Citromicrobium sp. JLT1363]|jgi:hypothetical protein|uniref:hypothetical protein n=1 Tax=Citromicrobium sp. JLT1363 TaxID=517722 RepID=UPI000225EA23|nr:hypothetical protein [Citromicrobium sp. JLT1363]|tara:strand:+ start:233 stop:418 length:186 start_codon:yes stop_codon:yes gene_type:complete